MLCPSACPIHLDGSWQRGYVGVVHFHRVDVHWLSLGESRDKGLGEGTPMGFRGRQACTGRHGWHRDSIWPVTGQHPSIGAGSADSTKLMPTTCVLACCRFGHATAVYARPCIGCRPPSALFLAYGQGKVWWRCRGGIKGYLARSHSLPSGKALPNALTPRRRTTPRRDGLPWKDPLWLSLCA